MHLVNDRDAVPVRLTTPVTEGFIVLAAEIGRWAGPFAWPSTARREVLRDAAALCTQLAARSDVLEAVVFRGALRPPGEGTELLIRDGARPARYDVVVLIRTGTIADMDNVASDGAFTRLVTVLGDSYQISASNAARIADVDHTRPDWFLFNYFHGGEDVYDFWEYTAGWFQANTALPNSTLLKPLDGDTGDYRVVNHASWPTLRTFLPSLTLRPSFRSFVLANFKANGIAAQPIIYRTASQHPGHGASQ